MSETRKSPAASKQPYGAKDQDRRGSAQDEEIDGKSVAALETGGGLRKITRVTLYYDSHEPSM